MRLSRLLTTLLLSLIFIGCGGGSGQTQTPTLHNNTSNTPLLSSQSVSQKLSYDKDGKITTIATQHPVSSIAVSQKTLFLSEGENGIEAIKIGYHDKISTELLFKIKDINAQHVILSDDEKTLYVEDNVGFIQIIDISDLSHPIRKGKTTKQTIDNAAISANKTYKYIPRGEDGLEVVNISNPSNHIIESTYKISNTFDVVLVDDDTKALIATGAVGINLLDIANPKQVETLANYRIRGSKVMGLSLNTTDELLFVATGDKGVMVFNVDILLHKLGY